MKSYDEQFDVLMEEFDFDKVLTVMRALDWTYFDGAPDDRKLREVVHSLWRSYRKWDAGASPDEEYPRYSACGGFELGVPSKDAPLKLSFIAEYAEDYDAVADWEDYE